MSNVIITSSSMGTLQACAENYRLRYVAGLAAVDRPRTLLMGSVFHDAVEAFRKGGTFFDMIDVVGGATELSPDDVCVLTAMVEAYHQKYRREAGNFTEVEMEFYYDGLGRDTVLAGKIDAVAKATPGHLLYETKTVGRIDGDYLDRLWSARQTLIYNRVLNQMGYDIQGVMYDLVGKPTIRRLLATPVEKRRYTKDKDTGQMRLHAKQRDRDESDAEFMERLREWYQRHPEALHRELIIYTPDQLESIEQDVKNEVKRLQWHIQSGVWPRSLSSCHRFNRPCEFSPLCSSGGNPVVLETKYQRRDKIHSELEGNREDK